MNKEYLFLGILFSLVTCLLLFNFFRERRFLKKKAKDTMDQKLRKEIDAERHHDLRKKMKFEDLMRRFEA